MSVQGEINRIKDAVSDAYSAVSDKGGEMPSIQNVDNLAQAVSSIPTGPDDTKMDKTNPTGTGSFSLNRKADTVVGANSATFGINCEATANSAFAEGVECRAIGVGAHAEGRATYASNSQAHAEGRETQATGSQSHAEGYHTAASGNYSHAEGNFTVASGYYSHAEGNFTVASGDRSHAEGVDTIASGDCSHAQGKYNVEDTNGVYADIVGWGDDENNRKNISALTTEGDLRLKGKVYVNCEDDSTGGTELGAGGESDVFVVEYGVTPFDDIRDAYLANKVCVIYDNNRIYRLVFCSGSIAYFLFTAHNGSNRLIAVASTDVWTETASPLIMKSSISTEISSASTDNQVASAKAVYAYIQSLDAREVSY